MKKSKQILTKTRNIIIMTVLIIFFLESNLFVHFRIFISEYFIFFQGKGILISNICLGILGSAILTYVSEYVEYNSVKRELEGDILSIYRKWDKEIAPQIMEQVNDLRYVETIGKNIYPFWEEVFLLYNTYLPDNRQRNIYVMLIKALYDYVKIFINYADNKQDIQEEHQENEEYIFNLINQNRYKLNNMALGADVMKWIYYNSEAEYQDFKQDMSDQKKEYRKHRRKYYFYGIKRYFRDIYYKSIFKHRFIYRFKHRFSNNKK